MNNSNDYKSKRIPEIYTALVLTFNQWVDIELIIHELKKIGIDEAEVRKPRTEPLICLDIAIVKYEQFWELNDALAKMFLAIDDCLRPLKNIIDKYQAETYIDIAFYYYGTYPALSIYGENMEKIRFLEANISIDPFEG